MPVVPRVVPLDDQRMRRIVARGLMLRCPRCGRAPLYAGFFRMHPRCTECGLRYEREQGYFVGAIYINYAFTVLIAVGTVLLLDATVGLSLTRQLVLGVALCALVPLVFFRYSRSLWLCMDYLVTLADERREHARQRRR
jgi:uncharacterized protein (DUF983 family)